MQFTKNLIGIAAIGTLFLTACGEGAQGPAGNDGQGCTVSTNDSGQSVVTCADGTEAILATGPEGPSGMDGMNGADGTDGAPGPRGMDGADGTDGAVGPMGMNGADGSDGSACTVFENGDGTRTITCEDGTSVTVTDGADGEDGLNGSDGQDGTNGVDGQNGRDGAPGTDGTSCTVVESRDGVTARIRCDDGTEANVSDGEDGMDGLDGTSCSVAQNDDGTITIACDDGSSVVLGSSEFIGFVQTFRWFDTNGNGVFDGTEQRTLFFFDARGNLKTETVESAAEGPLNSTHYRYDDQNQLTVQWTDEDNSGVFDGDEIRTSNEYNSDGRLISSVNEQPIGTRSTTSWTYDAEGRVLSKLIDDSSDGIFNESDERKTYTYDADGNRLTLSTEVASFGLRERYTSEYDESGNETSYTRETQLGVTWRRVITYDDDGNRITKWIDGCTYGCNEVANGQYDGEDTLYTYTVDDQGRETSRTEAIASSGTKYRIYLTYDADNRILVKWTDRNLNRNFDGDDSRLTKTYNGRGEMTRKLWENGSKGVVYETSYQYDPNGNLLTEWTDREICDDQDQCEPPNGIFDGTESRKIFTYDAADNLTLRHDELASGQRHRTQYGYRTVSFANDPCAPNPCEDVRVNGYGFDDEAISSKCIRGYLATAERPDVANGAVCICNEAWTLASPLTPSGNACVVFGLHDYR